MSRAYRIKVKDSLRRVIRAADHVKTQLELLEILPPEQMAGLLAEELQRRGFERKGDHVTRSERGVTVRVSVATGEVTVSAESEEKLQLGGERQTQVFDDLGIKRREAEEAMRKQLAASLQQEAERRAVELQQKVTDQLERALGDLRRELDSAVNRATAAALKIKAAQIGQIKHVTEDPQSGSLTIVVEV